MKRELFKVFEVDNGYMAEVAGGKIVVAATLPEVCIAATTAAVSRMLVEEEVPAEKEVNDPWLKLNP